MKYPLYSLICPLIHTILTRIYLSIYQIFPAAKTRYSLINTYLISLIRFVYSPFSNSPIRSLDKRYTSFGYHTITRDNLSGNLLDLCLIFLQKWCKRLIYICNLIHYKAYLHYNCAVYAV